MSANKSPESIKNLAGSEDVNKTTSSLISADNTETSNAAMPSTAQKLDEGNNKKADDMKLEQHKERTPVASTSSRMTIPESNPEFNQWLDAMKMVSRLPGGMPIEFRRKLWLALAERYLKRRGVDWEVEQVKWFSEKWRADDEELGIQIVKDLHRTGHSLLSGPSGSLNQAKLKRILMGYTRWNPEVGYCQGFNMLGAIILQVMEKNEVDSIKVMIFLIEGLLPNGYFCGSLMGLQADMAVFRELLGNKLPKLARHLQKLQSSNAEPSFEPPLINVFTMQWFLTLFCNCLPMNSVLRIWDLIMIEGSDVLLRAALAIWQILEHRILRQVKTADDFYCKMETLSAELLNGTLIDSNGMVQKISDLGPIKDLQKLRHKHLSASYQDQKKLKILYSSVDGETGDANAWANRTRRGSQPKLQTDREKIALDITILKKQYDKLRERQKQAHIILTSAVSKQHQQQQQMPAGPSHVNKLLAGKNAIISKGRRGPPKGSIPPARNLKAIKPLKAPPKHEVNNINHKDSDDPLKRRNSMSWKELNAERLAETIKPMSKSSSASALGNKPEPSSPKRRSDSSSYSEDSEGESSTSTSLCDEDVLGSSLEASPMKKKLHKDVSEHVLKAPSKPKSHKLPLKTDRNPEISIECSADDKEMSPTRATFYLDLSSNPDGDITSISQLSPMPDLSTFFTAISPIQSPCGYFEFPELNFSSFTSNLTNDEKFHVNEEGVTNEFFERITSSCNVFNLPENNRIMSTSHSSSVPCNEENPKLANDKETADATDSCDRSKYVKQKSLSMDEPSQSHMETSVINRSFSDGTIIVDDKADGIRKIIAENSKILNKLTFRTPDSSENVSESHSVKILIEPIIEEVKTPSNSSECDEIAAIDDFVEDAEEAKEEIFQSDIQDIADIKLETQTTQSNYSISDIVYNNEQYSIIDKKFSLDLSCNAYKPESDVTVENEKSIDETNAAALATLDCNFSTNVLVDVKIVDVKTLSVHDSAIKVEPRREEIKIESPKFNEIQLMVTKLKEEMESQLIKNSETEIVETQSVSAKETPEPGPDAVVEAAKPIVRNSDDVKKQEGIINELLDNNKNGKAPEQKLVINEMKMENIFELTDSDVIACKIIAEKDQDHEIASDLEKLSSEPMRKIDKNESDIIIEKLNSQLEKCQKMENKEIMHSESKIELPNKEKLTEIWGSERALRHNDDNDKKIVDSVDVDIKLGHSNQATSKEELKVEHENGENEKDSYKIIEKLNQQLQRYDESKKSRDSPRRDSRSPSAEEDSYKQSVSEIEALIKERELEKLSEKISIGRKAEALKDYDLSISKAPRSTIADASYRSEIHDPNKLIKYTNSLYDHEPRPDTRGREIANLETDQRMRRPFKSSPTSSLSSSPSNISSTLSSIQNTIKSLDSACQRTELYNYKKLDKAMENIEKICESDIEWKNYKKKIYDSPPSFRIDDILSENLSTSIRKQRSPPVDDDKLFTERSPRERSRDRSPRRSRYDNEFEEKIFRSSRDVSPLTSVQKTSEIDPEYVAKLKFLTTEEYIAGRKSPLSPSGSKTDIRQSTVTSTLYDRYQYCKKDGRIDRSPTSPILSKSSYSPRSPRSPMQNSSFLKSPSGEYRTTKSAENSPSRYAGLEPIGNRNRLSPTHSSDLKAESLSNLSYKSSSDRKYEYDWEKPSAVSNKNYDYKWE